MATKVIDKKKETEGSMAFNLRNVITDLFKANKVINVRQISEKMIKLHKVTATDSRIRGVLRSTQRKVHGELLRLRKGKIKLYFASKADYNKANKDSKFFATLIAKVK